MQHIVHILGRLPLENTVRSYLALLKAFFMRRFNPILFGVDENGTAVPLQVSIETVDVFQKKVAAVVVFSDPIDHFTLN